MRKPKRQPTGSKPVSLHIRDFAHLADVKLIFGDLTVLVGPQGAGKSLALQWLKVALDGREVVNALREAGHPVDRTDAIIDLIFGAGMGAAWKDDSTSVQYERFKITPKNLTRRGDGSPKLFFIPAHRSLLISDGWAAPFQKLNADTPAVARLFSQNLFDRFSGKDAGVLFPVEKRLKQAIREKIDEAIFHGGKVGVVEDQQHAFRLRLSHQDMHLPFMTWTAGQREFAPLLLGLYDLLPGTKLRKRAGTDWVVIEEPEMGLHPQAIMATMLLVLDLMWRGYRVVLSTHSPYVLTFLWAMESLQALNSGWSSVCKAFDIAPASMRAVATAALQKDYRAFLLQFDARGAVRSVDISSLDPESENKDIAGWGGLGAYASRFAEIVREAVNRNPS